MTTKVKDIRTFGAMTSDIIEMVEWIKENGCTYVATGSTGVY